MFNVTLLFNQLNVLTKSVLLRKHFFSVWRLLALALVAAPLSVYSNDIVRHMQKESEDDHRHFYFIQMLDLALSKTESTHGRYILKGDSPYMQQGRAISNLRKGVGLDVLWTMASSEREQLMHPVRVPLLKGLLGHRILIIRRGEEARFSDVRSLEDLQVFSAGQGHDWPDSDILSFNGIDVVNSPTYLGLFGMLELGRFDMLPRGASELWPEMESPKGKSLVIEPKLLLYYPAPIYFFVSKKNLLLAQRLEAGLRLAIQDGSFDMLFYSYPDIDRVIKNANLENRVVILLKNPMLSPETPIHDISLWVLQH